MITIIASGSRGDVQPYIALGQGLQDAGHEVRLLANDGFESLVTENGLAFASIGPNIDASLRSDEWRSVLESSNFIAILGKMRAEMKRHAQVIARRMPPLLADADLIVAGMAGMTGGVVAAERFNIPFIQAYVFPFTPTRAFPSPLVPNLPLGAFLNRPSYHVTHQLFWQNSNAADKAIRKALGMDPAPFWGPFRSLRRSQTPALYGYSPHVLPRPADWPANHLVTGYWFVDAPEAWTPRQDLVDFLKAGDAPVYIGFGSMMSRSPKEAGEIALEALARTGQRGILSAGWGGLEADDLPDTVHLVGSLPHSWLFPRMAAVVHHGGAGTTAAGLRAGVPSIVVPFMGDQPFWGRRVADLGVGPSPIPRKKLTGAGLAQAITEAVSNNDMGRRAAILGEQIRAEEGTRTAVALIEELGGL